MKFSEIISIAGLSGLYKYLAQTNNGIIVESLIDGKRFPVPSSSKVSALIDIAIYTEGEDMPLADVYQIMCEKLDGKESISHKVDKTMMINTMAEFVPEFDRDRVHMSDLKKLFQWYNILQSIGMSDYNSELKESEEEEEIAE